MVPDYHAGKLVLKTCLGRAKRTHISPKVAGGLKSAAGIKKSAFADSEVSKHLSQPAKAGFLIPDAGFNPSSLSTREADFWKPLS